MSDVPIEYLSKFADWVWTGFVIGFGYLFKSVNNNAKKVNDLALHVSDSYVKKEDMREIKEQVNEIYNHLISNK